ncbi:MAG TPA: DUF6048 family protein [Flavobacteriaceae bacterium]|nr:DUF6048 family protein [Flavobacteriaceae bacterium]
MKPGRTFLFSISVILVFCQQVFSQEEMAKDSVVYPEKFGVRVGVDLSKPVRSLLDDDYTGFEILGDYRVYRDYYAAVEFGNESFLYDEPNLKAETKGSYFKVGANYNAYSNWLDMQNSIYVGLRYGFSSFSETLESYSIYTDSDYFDPDIRTINQEYSDLTASWLEFQAGIKAEVLHNIFLGVHVELKRRLNQKAPTGFDNLYIPGFGKTYEGSFFGVGWGYSISYLIPIYSK